MHDNRLTTIVRRISKSKRNLPVIIEITTFGGIVSSPTWRVKPEWRGGTTRNDKRAIKSDRRAVVSTESSRGFIAENPYVQCYPARKKEWEIVLPELLAVV